MDEGKAAGAWEGVIEAPASAFTAKFSEFFSSACKKQFSRLLESDFPRITIDFAELERFDYKLADSLLEHPDDLIKDVRNAANSAVGFHFDDPNEILVSFANIPETQRLSLNHLKSSHLNQLVEVSGIVRAKTNVDHRVALACWKCKWCGTVYHVKQSGDKLVPPAFCECRHRDFELAEDASQFWDFQRVELQQKLEEVRATDQSNFLDCHLEGDLVNCALPGDTVKFAGILRLKPKKKGSPVMSSLFEVANFDIEKKPLADLVFSPQEVQEFKEFAEQDNSLDALIESVAPAVYGYEDLKEAILVQQTSGITKHIHGSRKRGEIHVLMVGDPAVAKSHLLTFACDMNSRGIKASGKGSSGVGLTASVEKSEDKTWVLKAGALVLANQGLLCVDEFDKLDDEHKGHLHEAMADGWITINKAGIYAKCRAETSVLAAANPLHSRFDPYLSVVEQFAISPTMLSRFDLIFLIKDEIDEDRDRAIADRIISCHEAGKRGESIAEVKSVEWVRKFLAFSKSFQPVLSELASKMLKDFYVRLRQKGKSGDGLAKDKFTATARQLDGLVRLSEAFARLRLSETVEVRDAERAISLFTRARAGILLDEDVDLVETGLTRNARDNREALLHELDVLEKEFDEVLIRDLREKCAFEGEVFDKVLRPLEREGELERPRSGIIKRVRK